MPADEWARSFGPVGKRDKNWSRPESYTSDRLDPPEAGLVQSRADVAQPAKGRCTGLTQIHGMGLAGPWAMTMRAAESTQTKTSPPVRSVPRGR
jgi:hypothetical protein